MKKFSKVILVITLFGALIALALGLCIAVDHFFGLTGLSVLLGISVICWIAYIVEDINTFWSLVKGKKTTVEDLRQRLVDAETENKTLSSQLSESNTSLMDMEGCCYQARKRASGLALERDEYRQRYEEAQKREELFQKALREKRAEIAYWREKYESAKIAKSAKQ